MIADHSIKMYFHIAKAVGGQRSRNMKGLELHDVMFMEMSSNGFPEVS